MPASIVCACTPEDVFSYHIFLINTWDSSQQHSLLPVELKGDFMFELKVIRGNIYICILTHIFALGELRCSHLLVLAPKRHCIFGQAEGQIAQKELSLVFSAQLKLIFMKIRYKYIQ